MIKIKNDMEMFEACSVSYGYEELGQYYKANNMQSFYLHLKQHLKMYYNEAIDAQYGFDDFENKKPRFIAGKVDFTLYSLNWEEALTVLHALYADYPLLFFVDNYKTAGDKNKHISPVIEAECSRGIFRRFQAEMIEEDIKSSVNSLNPLSNSREAAKSIYDLMKNKARYDHNKGEYTPYVDIPSHTILNYVRNRSAVCEGFAKTYQTILNYISIPTITIGVIIQGVGPHSANLSYFSEEKKWIMIDATQGITNPNVSGFDLPSNKYLKGERDTKYESFMYRPVYNDLWKQFINS